MTTNNSYEERPPEDTSAEEYHAEGDVESNETGTDYNPVTGEADATPHDRVLTEEDAEAGSHNAASSAGLEGDMGLSSERTGPADETGTGGLGELDELEGTGTVGSARGRTHGSVPTTGGPDLPAAPGRNAEADLAAHPDDEERPKRTVGESNTAEVPAHEAGHKNPGHSSGGSPPMR
ncbi:MAG TPA: hypothetical protein VGD51_02075 [Nocardioidaceae bacterium]